MMQLSTVLSDAEQEVVDKWKDNNLVIMESVNFRCYLLSMIGELEYESCFGKTTNSIERKQRYNLAVPQKVIKYYHYYLLQNQGEISKWYVGEMQENGSVEFYKCCESLEYAFQSL